MTGQVELDLPTAVAVPEPFRPEARKDRRPIVSAGYKLIVTPDDNSEELFDLILDLAETRPG